MQQEQVRLLRAQAREDDAEEGAELPEELAVDADTHRTRTRHTLAGLRRDRALVLADGLGVFARDTSPRTQHAEARLGRLFAHGRWQGKGLVVPHKRRRVCRRDMRGSQTAAVRYEQLDGAAIALCRVVQLLQALVQRHGIDMLALPTQTSPVPAQAPQTEQTLMAQRQHQQHQHECSA